MVSLTLNSGDALILDVYSLFYFDIERYYLLESNEWVKHIPIVFVKLYSSWRKKTICIK